MIFLRRLWTFDLEERVYYCVTVDRLSRCHRVITFWTSLMLFLLYQSGKKRFFPNEIQTNHRKSIIIIFVWKSNWLRHKVAHFVLSSFFKSFGRIQYVPRLSSKTYTKLWVRAFGKVKIYTSMSIKMKMMLCYIAPEANQFTLKLMRFKVHAKSSTK